MNPGAFASVFDWRLGAYRIYRLPVPRPLNGDPPPCPPGVAPTDVGIDVGDALCPLPPGAVPLGTGVDAVGVVMRDGAPRLMGPAQAPGLGGVAVLGGLGFVPVPAGMGQDERRPPSGLPPLGQAIAFSVAVNVVAGLLSPLIIRWLQGRRGEREA